MIILSQVRFVDQQRLSGKQTVCFNDMIVDDNDVDDAADDAADDDDGDGDVDGDDDDDDDDDEDDDE